MGFYLAIKKKEIESITGNWMELEIVFLSKVSQTLKNKCHVLSYMQNLDFL